MKTGNSHSPFIYKRVVVKTKQITYIYILMKLGKSYSMLNKHFDFPTKLAH